MRKPSFKKERDLDPNSFPQTPPRSMDDPRAAVAELIGGFVNPWRMWELLTQIRDRKGPLTQEDEDRLHRFGVLRPVDDDMIFDPDYPDGVEAFLLDLIAPHADVRDAIADAFVLIPEELAQSLCVLGQIAPDVARALLAGRIATAKRLWSDVSPDRRRMVEAGFHSIAGEMLAYHLLDSLWQAGEDTARRHFHPTGSPIIDGDGATETMLGSIDRRIGEIEVAIGVLDRIAAIEDEIRQKEAIERVFAPILGLARDWKRTLERQHGKALRSLLRTWDTTGRAIALTEAARIRAEIEKAREDAGTGKRAAAGRRDYKTVLGGVDETFYLGMQCAAYWIDDRISDVDHSDPKSGLPSSRIDTVIDLPKAPEPVPQPLHSRLAFKVLYTLILTFAVKSGRNDRKFVAAELKKQLGSDTPPTTTAVLEEVIDRLQTRVKVYHTSLVKPARQLWESRSDHPWTRRCLETECYGRFWLRLQL